ncbi:MAG: hypothetical protein ACYDHN_08955, partial [Solirubrobacteraceae bacterium]
MISTGPIYAETGCSGGGESILRVHALTRSEVAAVSVYGGRPIPTTTNITLPDGLRAAAVEVLTHDGRPRIESGCPRMTPFDAHGNPIRRKGRPAPPQEFSLPGTLRWEWPARPPRGACGLGARTLPHEVVVYTGDVATRIRPYRGLIGRAFISCVDTVYISEEQHHLTAAVLLDASHPGATPPPLPAMRSLPGHPGIYQAPGCSGRLFARRVPG